MAVVDAAEGVDPSAGVVYDDDWTGVDSKGGATVGFGDSG